MSMARTLMIAAAVALTAAACSSSEDTTTSTQPATSTTALVTTTTALVTTTTAVEQTTTTIGGEDTTTTTGAVEAAEIAATSTIGVLQPYSPDGGDLFPPGSVEAHWYRWEGRYVVLYRGFDAAADQEICAGNSVLIEGSGFNNVTNAPYLAGADEICIDAAKILLPPDGVRACGSLLYYLTEIPTDAAGTLFGTLEIGLGDNVFEGQTSQAVSDPAVPEFPPGLAAYQLPPSNVDDLGTVTCDT
jgi:hypothetical protein